LGEGEINTIIENSNAIINSEDGKIIELSKWGMTKLAFPIKKEIQGFYVFCDYSGTPDAVAEMERKFRIDDSVLRYLTVKTADSITDEEVAEATINVAAKAASREAGTPSERLSSDLNDEETDDDDISLDEN
jgi:small subunit ribosomal protein S6